MTIQVANVLIWQKNGKLRNLEFERNLVNVISGDPGKGKSSILYIIDYCLLASKPKGISKSNIDDKTDWYGLRVRTSRGIITIARPAYHKNTPNELYFSDYGDIPIHPSNNMRIDDLKSVLDREFGLNSDLKIPYGGNTIRAGSKITFRNFLPFCYQDQSALVSSEYLYIRPGDPKSVERIERSFRMAIGIVDAEGAIVSERVEKLRANLNSLERRADKMGKKVLEFEEDVVALEDEAIGLGLLNQNSENSADSLKSLQEISEAPLERFVQSSDEIKLLEQREFTIVNRLKRLKNFNAEYRNYQKLVKESTDAIAPVEFLINRYQELLPGSSTNQVLKALEIELSEMRESWTKRNDSVLFVDVKEQEKAYQVELEEVQRKITSIKESKAYTSSPKEIYHYQGKLEAKVDMYSGKASTEDYTGKISDIKRELSQLESKIRDMESRKEFIMGELNAKINVHLENLKLKGYDAAKAIFLEREKVVDLVLEEGNKVEKMEDIGSASNYLYLHLSYFMALHEIARKNKVSWMPSFLIIDQVSTPYSGETKDDILSLDTALKEIDSFATAMRDYGGFQIILMDHFPESHWTNLELKNFTLVDKELTGEHGLII